MGLPASVANIEWIPRTDLHCHKGNNTGRPSTPDAFQRGSGQFYQNLDVHDSGVPAGGS